MVKPFRWMLVAGVLAALAACSSDPIAVPPAQPKLGRSDAPVGGTCNAQAAQRVLGKGAGAQVVEQARVAAGARMARVLHPGQVITKEFYAERLNIEVDGQGVIVSVRCG